VKIWKKIWRVKLRKIRSQFRDSCWNWKYCGNSRGNSFSKQPGKQQRKYFYESSHHCFIIVMVLINFLANTIPLNKMTTGEISDYIPIFRTRRYDVFHMENYLSFAWSIYNLSIRHFQEKRRSIQQKFNRAPGNILFNFIHRKHGMDICMHYHAIGMSLVLTAVILACLIYINIKIRKANLETLEKLFIKLPSVFTSVGLQ